MIIELLTCTYVYTHSHMALAHVVGMKKEKESTNKDVPAVPDQITSSMNDVEHSFVRVQPSLTKNLFAITPDLSRRRSIQEKEKDP